MEDDQDIFPGECEVSISRRRKLPHWKYDNSIYFVTWRINKNQPKLRGEERELITRALKHFDLQRYSLFCFVVMDDHVHVLVRPHKEQPLAKILHSWKSYTAHKLQRDFVRKGSIWQDEYFDKIIRNEQEFYSVAKYILNNPWKRWKVEQYSWAWYKGE